MYRPAQVDAEQLPVVLAQACAARLSDTVALFQALGGGWWNRIEPPTETVFDVGSGLAATLMDTHYAPDATRRRAIIDELKALPRR
jgi:hypothetical protein